MTRIRARIDWRHSCTTISDYALAISTPACASTPRRSRPLGYVLCSRDDCGAGFGPKGEPALWLHLHKGKAAGRRPCRLPRARPRRGQEIPRRGIEGRRPRQWRRGPARGLQPDLLRRVPDRSRRQQCRGGVHVDAHPVIARSDSDEAIQLSCRGRSWIASRSLSSGRAFARLAGSAMTISTRKGTIPWLPSTKTSSSTRRPEDVWDAVRDFGALHHAAGAGLRDRHQARRRRAHRHLRQRHGGARAAGRLRRREAAAGLCHHQRAREAAQRLGAGVRRGRRHAAGWCGSSTCCRTKSRPTSDAPDGSGRAGNAEGVRAQRGLSIPWAADGHSSARADIHGLCDLSHRKPRARS